MAYSERELIARMIQCEAGGEGDNGMKAVASVIMNRVNVPNGEYARISQGGNIRNILFQQVQFDCTANRIYCFFTLAATLNIFETSWSFNTNEIVKIISNINIVRLTNIFFILLFFSFSMLSSFSVLNLSFICDF